MNEAHFLVGNDRRAGRLATVFLREAWPLLALCIANYVTFRLHYQGRASFPWDFLGGYHAQAFGWFDNGSVTSPPAWFPWTNMGFPAFLAIQSGAWYLPLALIHSLGIVYTVHAATVVQVLHVLFGAVGAYVLVRRLSGTVFAALIAGLAYHYGAAFYSNQEHVDIVRAAAWLPWLLYALHPESFARSRLNVALACVVLSQLLVSGYPGNIVSSIYACAVWTTINFLGLPDRSSRREYAMAVSIAVLAGTLMAMLKWAPLVLNGANGVSLEHFPPQPFDLIHLFTLFTPYDIDAIPGDRTMRSLWLPSLAIWGMAFAHYRSRTCRLGLGLIAVGVALGMVVPDVALLARIVPGASLSRFPLSDWRPVIQLGIIVAASDGWRRFIRLECSYQRIVVGSMAMLCIGAMACVSAAKFGFDGTAVARMAKFFALGAAASCVLPVLWPYRARFTWIVPASSALFVIICANDGYSFHRSQAATWRPAWDAGAEAAWLGGDFNAFRAQRGPLSQIERRPSRFVVGADVAQAVAARNSAYYNRCWYMRAYCLFGYDNLRMSNSHRLLLEALEKPEKDALFDFIRRPQQLLFLLGGTPDTVPALNASPDSPSVGREKDVHVQFVRYGAADVEYQLAVPEPLQVVENEIWWPGWKVTMCRDTGGCDDQADTTSTSQGLRSWHIKKGAWTVRLHFAGPSMLVGYVCAALGAGLLVFFWIITGVQVRRRLGLQPANRA